MQMSMKNFQDSLYQYYEKEHMPVWIYNQNNDLCFTNFTTPILLHLMDEARLRGYSRMSLETGRPEEFLPARSRYEAHGFAECAPFGDYVSDDFSICMTRLL